MKPKKRVQFHNVVTEPDIIADETEFNEASFVEHSSSHELSRQDTMVEHSIVVNEEEEQAPSNMEGIG